jgi:hypothetical protein
MEVYMFLQNVGSLSLDYRALYVRVLINLRLFRFAAHPKEFFLGGLKKLEQ